MRLASVRKKNKFVLKSFVKDLAFRCTFMFMDWNAPSNTGAPETARIVFLLKASKAYEGKNQRKTISCRLSHPGLARTLLVHKKEMHMKAKTFMNTFKLNVTRLRANVIFARDFR